MEILSSFMFWSFIASALILYRFGEMCKNLVLGKTKKEVDESIKINWKRIYHDTMMFHPVVLGGLLGLALVPVVPEIVAMGGKVGSVLYFALSGVLSTWIFDLVKRTLRQLNIIRPENKNKS